MLATSGSRIATASTTATLASTAASSTPTHQQPGFAELPPDLILRIMVRLRSPALVLLSCCSTSLHAHSEPLLRSLPQRALADLLELDAEDRLKRAFDLWTHGRHVLRNRMIGFIRQYQIASASESAAWLVGVLGFRPGRLSGAQLGIAMEGMK